MNIMGKTWLLFFAFLFFSEVSFAARTINSVTVDGASTTTVSVGATISASVNVTTTNPGGNNWKATGWRIDTNPGVLSCIDHADITTATTTDISFDITAPSTNGLYNLYLRAYPKDNCTGSPSSQSELPNAVTAVSELNCSAEASNAVINEIQTTDNFIELYLLNSTDIINWALYVDDVNIARLGTGNCEINGTSDKDNTGSGATNSAFPAGTFITCDFNVNPSKAEILLVDTSSAFSSGDNVVIDYIGYGNLTPSSIWDINASCGSLYPGHNANNKDIARIPDGTGALVDNASNSTKGKSNASPSNAIDHYEIYHDGSGITCLSEDINIKACTNADCSSVASEDITATLNLGALGQAVTISNGNITPNVNYTTAGTIAISLSNLSTSAPVDCYVNNVASASCEMILADSAFIIDVPTLTACKPNATATIQAVQTDTHTNTCGAAFTGEKTVEFWSTYISPNTGTTDLLINTTAISDSSPGTGVLLNFDNAGLATFTVQYNDAGQVQLDAEITDGSIFYGTGTGLVLKGDDTFVSKPFILTVYTDETNYECTSGDATCSLFKKAGENFDLKVNAACWESDSDTDYRDNPVTPNFEMSSIAVISNVVAPSGGSSGNLDVSSFNFATTDNGTHTMDQAISEVGVFTFAISPSNYFGEALTTQNSPYIGRFYPDHFEVTNSENGAFGNNACTGFSYSGQSFTYAVNPQLQITAYNAATPDAVTQNYTGGFVKLTTADFIYTLPTTDASQPGADNANLVRINRFADMTTIIDNANGSLEFAFGDDSYTYLHESNSQIAPFSNAVDLQFTDITDSDNVQTQALPATLQPSGEPIRFGRLTIANAHGSELVPLDVAVQVEFFNGNNWQPNTLDQCTSINMSPDFQLSNPETANGSLQAGTATMTLDGGTTSAALTNSSPLANGVATMTFAAPGEDNQGYVDIQSQTSLNFGWLLGDYDNDGVYDDEATGRASFGLFKGSENIIFRREVY